MFPCSGVPRSSSSMCAAAASISTAPSAPAATARAILDAADAQVIAIDRDQRAVADAPACVQASGGRLTRGRRAPRRSIDVAKKFGHEQVDGVVLDIGVSSMQLDQAERGFSFRLDGPLDMRMGGDGPSAADVVALAAERDLADIIFQLGEERHSRAVARAIVARAQERRSTTTKALADIVGRVVHAKPGRFIRRRGRSRRCACSSTKS